MANVLISGVPILFPFRPYRSQMLLMNRIISGLKSGQNCLLESPTGTGKTLAILCACLAWQRALLRADQQMPTILYGTRTHKQIAQLVQQLRMTEYGKDVRMTILSSREHTCIHPEVSRSATKAEDCKAMARSPATMPKCSYSNGRFKNHFDFRNARIKIDPSSIGSDAFDVEDLVQTCRSKHTCPYYFAKTLAAQSDLIFCPYNFLIDPRVSASIDLKLDHCIVVLDEAHNIDEQAREGMSFTVNRLRLNELISELYALVRRDGENDGRACMTTEVRCALAFLTPRFDALSRWIDSYELPVIDVRKSGLTIPIFEAVEALTKIGLGATSISQVRSHMSILFKEQSPEESPDQDAIVQWVSERGHFIMEEVVLALETVYSDDMKFVEDYNVALTQEVDSRLSIEERSAVLRFICNNPAVAFHRLRDKLHSLIVCSGTLAPIHSFSAELGIEFHQSVEADHIVSENRVLAIAVSRGPLGYPMRCNFRNSGTFDYQDELGRTILAVGRSVGRRGGILVFLPSYRLMNSLFQRWAATGLWDELAKEKSLFSENNPEPYLLKEEHKHLIDTKASRRRRRRQKATVDVIELYCEAAKVEPGAILFGVFRGRVSEGLDFSDDTARCVITVGLPYPNLMEMTVDLKRKYNDRRKAREDGPVDLISGSEWYDIQAFRALNQALGRCLRHRNDWGSLVLVDDRFHRNSPCLKQISKWIRDRLYFNDQFDDVSRKLREFHEKMEKERDSEVENRETPAASEPLQRSNTSLQEVRHFLNMRRMSEYTGTDDVTHNQTKAKKRRQSQAYRNNSLHAGDALISTGRYFEPQRKLGGMQRSGAGIAFDIDPTTGDWKEPDVVDLTADDTPEECDNNKSTKNECIGLQKSEANFDTKCHDASLCGRRCDDSEDFL